MQKNTISASLLIFVFHIEETVSIFFLGQRMRYLTYELYVVV